MKKTFPLIIAMLSISMILRAADAPELDKLQVSHRAVVEKVTKPLTQTYLRELEKLRDAQARATKLDAATTVQAEIDAISKPGASGAASAVATTVDIPELDKLKASYYAAIERATSPLIQAHLTDLEKLRDGYTRGAKLDSAVKVQAEMDSVYQRIALAKAGKGLPPALQDLSAAPGGTKPGAANVRPPNPKWLEGRTWATNAGNKLTFSRGGSGVRTTKSGETPFKWRILPTGFVQVDGEGRPPDAPFTLLVEFKNESEGAFGNVSIHVE